ncbi:GntR family transcriptional regulator [Paenibacillus sp. FSL P4-0081]|uniref:GntR family transcriptional regulator n=1 Tax=unclassified Paenibacillus TaxID=185978 RepID=UPI0004F75FAA|nr:GntR family transcriptional regulator [Paenibacillus sp. FSL P4-0081]AIQ31565.1 GntR family transcriptional regulator [Paenibacillus sp. FSL P4-0081]
MEIILSSASSRPIYEQITSQIKEMIMKGELKPEDILPSMRKLAKDLHVSVITTQKAYENLQRDGFIETIPAKGTFVSSQNKDFIVEENRRRIEEMLEEASVLARENGISLDEIIKVIRVMYKEDKE